MKPVALEAISQTEQNRSLLAKWVQLERMSHTLLTWVTLIKIVAPRSMSQTVQNGSHLTKCVNLERMSHTL